MLAPPRLFELNKRNRNYNGDPLPANLQYL